MYQYSQGIRLLDKMAIFLNRKKLNTSKAFESNVPLRDQMLKFLNYDAFLFLKIVFIFVNSAYPDVMPHHYIWVFTVCQGSLFTNIQNEKD